MIEISLENVQKSYGEHNLLKKINMDIEGNDRIGLVGRNGTGKTTIANIIAGYVEADAGHIRMRRNTIKIGYLKQSVEYTENHFKHIFDSSEEDQLFKGTSQLGLEKSRNWSSERLRHLSGGERLKLAISHIWSQNPELLILDEPTNHLDTKGIKWLKNELDTFKGMVLIISHDRYFLDQTVRKIYEIEAGELNLYEGNYSDYKRQKEERRKIQQQHYNQQQKEVKRIESQMDQLQNWSEKAHRESTKLEGYKEFYRVKAKKMDAQVKSKKKRLEAELKKHKVEKPIDEQKVFFDFKSNEKHGKRIIEARSIHKSYDNHLLIRDGYFYISRGEKIGLTGENGSGKTTLIRMILGEERVDNGELWISPSLKVGYLSQDVHDLPLHQEPIDALGLSDRLTIQRAKTIFANLGLKEKLLEQPVSSLSLGQRMKVKLVGLLLDEADLLILDEPTNHLDLPSREQLEETLMNYPGTLLIVSHDVYLLNKLCEQRLCIEKGEIKREHRDRIENKQKPQNEENVLLLDTRIVALLGKLSAVQPNTLEYVKYDDELKQLMELKKTL